MPRTLNLLALTIVPGIEPFRKLSFPTSAIASKPPALFRDQRTARIETALVCWKSSKYGRELVFERNFGGSFWLGDLHRYPIGPQL